MLCSFICIFSHEKLLANLYQYLPSRKGDQSSSQQGRSILQSIPLPVSTPLERGINPPKHTITSIHPSRKGDQSSKAYHYQHPHSRKGDQSSNHTLQQGRSILQSIPLPVSTLQLGSSVLILSRVTATTTTEGLQQ